MAKRISKLKWSLFPGVIYFFGVSIAHMTGIKIPLLYIYFNIPSYGYQDKIISFLSLGWALFFLIAFINPVKNMHVIKTVLIAGFGAIIGLGIINVSTDLRGLATTTHIVVFWIELLILFFYLIVLCVFFWRAKKS
jgi:hypothetical protein